MQPDPHMTRSATLSAGSTANDDTTLASDPWPRRAKLVFGAVDQACKKWHIAP
jgi:hypothetical protein